MYGEMGAKSNTMIFSDKPADINSLMAQAGAVFQGVQGANMLPQEVVEVEKTNHKTKHDQVEVRTPPRR
jgi:hypothetical protein